MFQDEIEKSIKERNNNYYYIFLWLPELRIIPNKNFIIYNLEPLFRYSKFPNYNLKNQNTNMIIYAYSKCNIIFDYSEANLKKYPNYLKDKSVYFPIPLLNNDTLYNSELYSTDIDLKDRKTDILFFGCLNSERRNKTLKEIREKTDLNIKICDDIFGEDLYKEIRNSKIVLNIHFNQKSLLETARIHDCLRKHDCFIISEESCEEDKEIMRWYKDLVEFIPLIDINKNNCFDILINKINNIIKQINSNTNQENIIRKKDKIINVMKLNSRYNKYFFF